MAIDLAIPAGTFGDIDGDTLTLTARLADGTALPAWLLFDGTRFTGTPPADFHGALDIEVIASDGALAASDVFRLTVTPVNDRPAVLTPLADVTTAEDQPIDIVLPAGSFGDVDGDSLTLTATLAERHAAAGLAELRRRALHRHAAGRLPRQPRPRRHRERRRARRSAIRSG